MDWADESIELAARLVDLDAAGASAAVLGLRREFSGITHRWTLGDQGILELDAAFEGMTLASPTMALTQRVHTSGRLWPPARLGAVAIDFVVVSTPAPPTQITIEALRAINPADIDDVCALARTALDELAEELLYHAAALRNARAATTD